MNGNITREGIRKDIEWMDRAGLAGFHLFDAGFNVPQIVDERMPFMSEGWKREFNFALDLADSLGFEVSVASSPGWSVTGGPWVSRDDAMKKLVWSETIVEKGRFHRPLPEPPHVAGFYQTLRQYKTDSGKTEEASYNISGGRTTVTLHLVPDDAQFVLFEGLADEMEHHATVPGLETAMTLEGSWKVTFQPGRGAPESIELSRLARLDKQADPGVKHYSGTAAYTKAFDFKPMEGCSYVLDLGEVHDLARVYLNGKDIGLAWKEPFMLSASEALQDGSNILEVRVINTWHNRIIGDLQPGADKITYTSYPFYNAGSPLRESGLVGPVRIRIVTSD